MVGVKQNQNETDSQDESMVQWKSKDKCCKGDDGKDTV